MSGMALVTFSGRTCALGQKTYCAVKDTCVPERDCSSCPDQKTTYSGPESNMCVGVPTKLPDNVSFTDFDMLMGSVGGYVDIKQDRSSKSMDVESYVLRWGR